MHRVHHTFDIGGQQRVEVVVSDVAQPRDPRETCVRHDDIQTSSGCADLRIEPVEIAGHPDITAHRDPAVAQLFDGGVEFGLPTAGDEHPGGAFGDEALGGSEPDAGVPPGDDGGLAIE